MQINGSRRYAAVSQKLLNCENVSSIFQEMGSKSVTKGMDRYPPRDTSHPKPFLQRVINRFLCYAG